MKKYLKVTVVRLDGVTDLHLLKLSQAYRISKLAQGSRRVVVEVGLMGHFNYRTTFG